MQAVGKVESPVFPLLFPSYRPSLTTPGKSRNRFLNGATHIAQSFLFLDFFLFPCSQLQTFQFQKTKVSPQITDHSLKLLMYWYMLLCSINVCYCYVLFCIVICYFYVLLYAIVMYCYMLLLYIVICYCYVLLYSCYGTNCLFHVRQNTWSRNGK